MNEEDTLRGQRTHFARLRETNTGEDAALKKRLVTMHLGIMRAENQLMDVSPRLEDLLAIYDPPVETPTPPSNPEGFDLSDEVRRTVAARMEGDARSLEKARVACRIFDIVRPHLERGDVGVVARIRRNELLTRLRGELLWLSDAARGFIPECKTPVHVLQQLAQLKMQTFCVLLDAEIWDEPGELIRPSELK